MARALHLENGELANDGISKLSSIRHAYMSTDTYSPVSKLPPNPDLRNRQRSYSTKLSRVCSIPPFTYSELNSYHVRLPRPLNGRFKDAELARVLQQATERSAGAFGYHQVPLCARVHELQKIEEARNSKACTLNEYRRALGLRRMSCSNRLDIFSNFLLQYSAQVFH